MKIQLITARPLQKENFQHITISEFGKPLSLDEFDVNVIDLGASDLWKTKNQHLDSIDRITDFDSIQSMVMHRNNAFVVYVLPQDVTVLSLDYQKGPYKKETRLKDAIEFCEKVVKRCYPTGTWLSDILYEKTKTKIGLKTYTADFYFESGHHPVSRSEMSEKITTNKYGDLLYATTLDIITSEECLTEYVENIIPKPKREAVPQWMDSIEFFDDREQKEKIEKKEQIIEQAQTSINSSRVRLEDNNYYKSILYTNGDELVEVVFSILEKILSCDLSGFVDEKKEDFIIKKEGYTLIGEIKGVTSNIKSENISQVDVHFQGYMDKLTEAGVQESVHQVLIMNPLRNKPLWEREPVHETQIRLARRNGCLVIETVTLLKLYEKFVAGEISIAECERLFTEKTGLLKETDFN